MLVAVAVVAVRKHQENVNRAEQREHHCLDRSEQQGKQEDWQLERYTEPLPHGQLGDVVLLAEAEHAVDGCRAAGDGREQNDA